MGSQAQSFISRFSPLQIATAVLVVAVVILFILTANSCSANNTLKAENDSLSQAAISTQTELNSAKASAASASQQVTELQAQIDAAAAENTSEGDEG